RRDEPQPLPGLRDDFPHSVGAAHVHLGDAGARDRLPWRGRVQVCPSLGAKEAERQSQNPALALAARTEVGGAASLHDAFHLLIAAPAALARAVVDPVALLK